VQFPFEYPSEVPTLSIEKGKGLSDEQVKDLQSSLMRKAKELLGSVMVFDLAQQVVEYLQAHNQKPMSFYDEMIARQNAEKAALQKKAESDKKKDTLEELISAELARQSELPDEYEESSESASGDNHSLNFSLNESLDHFPSEIQDRVMSLKSSISSDKSNRSDTQKFAHKWQKRIELRKDKFGTVSLFTCLTVY
jgi:translation initiation factor 2-alpha kinase 4